MKNKDEYANLNRSITVEEIEKRIAEQNKEYNNAKENLKKTIDLKRTHTKANLEKAYDEYMKSMRELYL